MKRVALLLCLSPFAFAQTQVPNIFEDGQLAKAAEVNENFDALESAIDSNEQDFEEFRANTQLVLPPGNCSIDQIIKWNGSAWICSDSSGVDTPASHTDSDNNTAVGLTALYSNTIGSSNTASGRSALYTNTEGKGNTAIGLQALVFNTTGNGNTASGRYALFNNTTGDSNIAIGNLALSRNFSGDANTAVGTLADATASNLSNATAIGYNARVDASNKIQLGNTDVTSVATAGKITTGDVTYPNAHGNAGQVLGTNGSGELVWLNSSQILASHTQDLEEQVVSLQQQLQSQQEELLAIVQSQQEQIAQLQQMVEHQFAAR